MAGHSDKNFIELSVRSTSGTFSDRFNLHQKGEHVLGEAIRQLGLDANGTYVLIREADGRQLSLSEKLGDLGLVNGDVLILQTNQAQDG